MEKMKKQIMGYFINKMCNLHLWGSSQEVVVYKKTNNYIYAPIGISPGLKGICIQIWVFSVWSKFQNEPANELS